MAAAADDETTHATRAVLHRYEHELYGGPNLDLVDELLSDPMYRHDAGGAVTAMSHADCRARIGGFLRDFDELRFRTIHMIVEGNFASWTYELTAVAPDGAESVMSSIEVFEIIDGRIARVWNAAYTDGPWA